jgi:hypothetical protein
MFCNEFAGDQNVQDLPVILGSSNTLNSWRVPNILCKGAGYFSLLHKSESLIELFYFLPNIYVGKLHN